MSQSNSVYIEDKPDMIIIKSIATVIDEVGMSGAMIAFTANMSTCPEESKELMQAVIDTMRSRIAAGVFRWDITAWYLDEKKRWEENK